MREKLIELIQGAFNKCCSMICAQECDYYDKDLKAADRSCQAKLFADMLIANGVTFAKDTKVPINHESITIKPDGIHELSPHKFVLEKRLRNVTVEILRCTECGEVSVGWRKQDNTEDITEGEGNE